MQLVKYFNIRFQGHLGEPYKLRFLANMSVKGKGAKSMSAKKLFAWKFLMWGENNLKISVLKKLLFEMKEIADILQKFQGP